eukprot:scaffold13554_cov196-Alexandrium_tamarense.AAC.11
MTVSLLLEGSISDTTSADIMTSTQSSALSVADYGATDHMFPDMYAWGTSRWLQSLAWVLLSSLSMERRIWFEIACTFLLSAILSTVYGLTYSRKAVVSSVMLTWGPLGTNVVASDLDYAQPRVSARHVAITDDDANSLLPSLPHVIPPETQPPPDPLPRSLSDMAPDEIQQRIPLVDKPV